MFTIPIRIGGSILSSGVSSLSYTQSDVIDLARKRYDNHRMALLIDLSGTTVSGGTAVLYITCSVGDSLLSGASFATILTGSGTSVLLASGTSRGGLANNGVYYQPITQVLGSGVTDFMAVPSKMKIGHRSMGTTPQLSIKLLLS